MKKAIGSDGRNKVIDGENIGSTENRYPQKDEIIKECDSVQITVPPCGCVLTEIIVKTDRIKGECLNSFEF